jgi:hypothetical protein
MLIRKRAKKSCEFGWSPWFLYVGRTQLMRNSVWQTRVLAAASMLQTWSQKAFAAARTSQCSACMKFTGACHLLFLDFVL